MTDHVDDYGSRISTLETDVRELTIKIDSGFVKVSDGFGKLFDRLSGLERSFTQVEARQPISWDKILAAVQSLGVLFAMTSAGIIYIASNISNSNITTIEHRQAVLEQHLAVLEQTLPLMIVNAVQGAPQPWGATTTAAAPAAPIPRRTR